MLCKAISLSPVPPPPINGETQTLIIRVSPLSCKSNKYAVPTLPTSGAPLSQIYVEKRLTKLARGLLMSRGKDLQLGELSEAVWGEGGGLGEAVGCQGGSAGTDTATAGRAHGQVPAQTHMLDAFLGGVLSKVGTERSMEALSNAKIQMLIGLWCLLVYNGKKVTIPNPYLELGKGQAVMKLLLFIHPGLKRHEH